MLGIWGSIGRWDSPSVLTSAKPNAKDTDILTQVFAKGTSALGSNTFTRASGLNVPVQFTSETQKRPLTINPGDLILADQDGVVVVPVEHAEKCLKICEERFAIDEKTMEALKKGEPMGETLARLRK